MEEHDEIMNEVEGTEEDEGDEGDDAEDNKKDGEVEQEGRERRGGGDDYSKTYRLCYSLR